MTKNEWKEAYKYCIDNGYKNLSQNQKELLKRAVEEARTVEECFLAVYTAIILNR